MRAAVRVVDVTKVFGAGPLAFTALRGVSMEVQPGEIVMMLGPSGSGKTTLLSILGCVLRPTAGSVELFGTDVARLRERDLPAVRRALIGFVFQGHNLVASSTARENVSLALELQGVPGARARRRAEEILERVGLASKLASFPAQLSGGQRQRVAIARALATDPPLVLADEPTAALDAESGLAVTELLAELSRERGTSVVVVTHDPRILGLADRRIEITDGAITDGAIATGGAS